ncbi:MAG: hypothetical protein C0519_11255 [Hyphomicrobium sp.]|nr:hypothetical protein [Hyphomicrobium sp.]PPD06351.1 MAG: hypothetical protein CTY28_13885 [Hyphomicrobium sp.]
MIGTMLPCHVVVQEMSKGSVEVSAVVSVASMMAVANSKSVDELAADFLK